MKEPAMTRRSAMKNSMNFLRTQHFRRIVAFRDMNLKTSSLTNPKKPRNGALSIGDKLLNRAISSSRIVVEHVIAGIKRCRIVKDVLRNTRAEFEDIVMEVACGLHNFRQKLRSKSERVNIFDMM